MNSQRYQVKSLPSEWKSSYPQTSTRREQSLARASDKFSQQETTRSFIMKSHCQLVASAIASTMKVNELMSDQLKEPICSVNSSRDFSFSTNSCQSQLSKAQRNSLEESWLKRQRCRDTEVITKNSSIDNSIKSHLSRSLVQSESPQWRTREGLEVKWFGHSTQAGISMVCLAVLCVAALSINSITCVALKSKQGNTFSDNNSIPYNPNQASSEQGQKNWNTKYADDEWPQESSETNSYSDVTFDVAKSDDNVCRNDNCIEITGLLTHILDKNVNPCDDFYKFTCGNYASFYPIPKFLKSWNNFERVFYDIRKQLTGLLNNKEKFANVIHNATYFEKLNQFYQGCINQKQRDISGYRSLFKLIEELGGWPMIDEEWTDKSFNFEKTYFRLTKLNLFFFFRIEAMTDHKNSKNTIFRISPPYKAKENIVNLKHFKKFWPTREFSFSFEGRRSASIVPKPQTTDRMTVKYKEVIKELKVSSLKDPNSLNMTAFEINLDYNFENISDVQNKLEYHAKPMSPTLALQSNYTIYMKNLTEIEKMVGFNLTFLVEEMFGIKVTDTQQFFVPDPDYLKELGKLLQSTENSVISNYFITNMVMSLAGHTTSKMINLLTTKLDANSATAHEQFENICFEEASLYLPELLGKLYLYVIDVHKHEPVDQLPINQPATNCTTCTWKKDVDLLVKLLRESFYQSLTESNWMEKETINEAITKLNSMSMNIGFPEWYGNETQFEQYCDMFTNINQNDYFNSVVNVNDAGHSLLKQQHSERALGGTSAQLSWPGHRQIIDVNAFYYFATNGVYIPVAIAQYPFYVPTLPKAVIFGSLGMIIGHEMTHAFDNTGRLYDHQGALTNWWTDKTLESFNDKTNCFVEQYSNFTMNDSINIDGNQTLAENIADNGGLRQAYYAFKKYQKQTSSSPDLRMPASLKIYTPEQLFFISYAHMWCNQMDPDDIESDIRKNVHSPPQIRVFGTLANFNEFSNAFKCPIDSRMNPKHKCVLW